MHLMTGYKGLIGLGLLALGGLLVVQVYWFCSAYRLEEKHLREQITLALRDVTNRLSDLDIAVLPASMQQVASNRYEVSYGGGVTYETLDSLVRDVLITHNVRIPFEMVGYDDSRKIAFGNVYKGGATTVDDAMCLNYGMRSAKTGFVTITFSDQPSVIAGGMDLWIFSATLFILVLGGALLMMVRLSRDKRRAELRADFISNMTHELQTPIANIALASDVLCQDKDITSRSQHYARIISSENQRLRSHIDQVLQTALLEKGELAFAKQEVNLNEVVKEIASIFSERLKVRGGQLLLSIQATNPVVFADILHLKNLLYNLLDNAEKYSRDTPLITVETRNAANGVALVVSDKGVGIGKEYQLKIFDKFFRAPKGNLHDIKGFGLGLTYVKGIVEAHNGTVSVVSEPGEGSRFEVLLQNLV